MENSILYEIEQDGIKKGMKKVVKNLKELGIDEKTIQQSTGLTTEQINKL